MNATTVSRVSASVVGVDVAKSVFQLAAADGSWKVIETHRLTRSQFERWFAHRYGHGGSHQRQRESFQECSALRHLVRSHPKGVSSGNSRYLGRISKQGDKYLRMLLTHGARSVLRAATVARQAGRTLDPLRSWAIAVQGRTNHNKAACVLSWVGSPFMKC